jgi:S-formylglutathione hydrolase FrmB
MRRMMVSVLLWFLASRAAAETQFGPAVKDADGVITHTIDSPHQAGPTDVRILLPTTIAPGTKLPVVYLLPVEAGRGSRYGDAIAEVRALDAANRWRVICVAPTFAALPWYADHPTDARLAQESYFVKEVVPFVEAKYPALAERGGRFLCGFSKSGWGAWSLLLRHPDRFERAASWDAPLLMDAPGKYGSGPIFGDADNFSRYQITKLLDATASQLTATASDRSPPRLILLGFGSFVDHRPIHEQLDRLGVPHVYRDGPQTPHIWSRAWLEPALEALSSQP